MVSKIWTGDVLVLLTQHDSTGTPDAEHASSNVHSDASLTPEERQVMSCRGGVATTYLPQHMFPRNGREKIAPDISSSMIYPLGGFKQAYIFR